MQNPQSKLISISASVIAAVVVAVNLAACTDSNAKVKPNFVYKDAPGADVVAKIDGKTLTEEELVGDEKVQFFDLKKKIWEFKMDRIKTVMAERLLGGEAKKAGMSTEDFINKKVTGGEIKISDKEYNDFVKDKRIPESSINPSLKDRIMTYLKENKKDEVVSNYVAKLTKSNPVEIYFTKPKMNIQVATDGAPFYGKKDAPVHIVAFSDFQCPFCARAAETVKDLRKKYGNKISIAFMNFPLPMHSQAKPAAEAGLCVHEQGDDKFWKFHDIVFENQRALDDKALADYAKKAGADEKKFNDCYASKKYTADVEKSTAYGEKLGVRSTPTFFINGELVSGAVPIDEFSQVIDSALDEPGNG